MEQEKPKHGTINWTDLTIPNAEEVKEFYKTVIGWTEQAIPMKDGDEEYNDFVMLHSENGAAGGICHSKGTNLGIPPQWIPYISVNDIEKRKNLAIEHGGEILKEQLNKDGELYYVIMKDISGAIFAMARI